MGNFLVTACVPLLPFPDRFELHQRIHHTHHSPRLLHSPLASHTGNYKSDRFPGSRGSPCGQLSVPWDYRKMTWSRKMENITPAPRVVTGLQGASFILYFSDLRLGTNSVLSTQGKRLNHTLVSYRVCGMCEAVSFVSSLKNFIFITVFTSEWR